MMEKATRSEPQTRADAEDSPGGGGAAGRKRHKPLDSLERVRRELARVYYEFKDGQAQADVAKTRTYILGQMVAVLKAEQSSDTELLRRIEQLEQQLRGKV